MKPVWIFKAAYSSVESVFLSHSASGLRNCSFGCGPEQGGLQQIRAALPPLCPWPHHPAHPVVFAVSATGRDMVGAFGRTLTGGSQSRPSGIWSKALPSLMDNASPFQKKLMVCCYSTPAQTEHLTGATRFLSDLSSPS